MVYKLLNKSSQQSVIQALLLLSRTLLILITSAALIVAYTYSLQISFLILSFNKTF